MLNAECGMRNARPGLPPPRFRIHHWAFTIPVARQSGEAPKSVAKVRKAIGAVLRRHGVVRARIGVALVSDAAMARLNRDHLGRHGPTDVLSFDLRDPADEKTAIDGEIVMSVERAVNEARERGHAVEAELALYAVHGTLHLLGYDDRRKADADRMHEVEDEILSSLGWGPIFTGPTNGEC